MATNQFQNLEVSEMERIDGGIGVLGAVCMCYGAIYTAVGIETGNKACQYTGYALTTIGGILPV